MKYKATEGFKSLGQESSYQGLPTEIYVALKRGETVEIPNPPRHLIDGKYIERARKPKEIEDVPGH